MSNTVTLKQEGEHFVTDGIIVCKSSNTSDSILLLSQNSTYFDDCKVFCCIFLQFVLFILFVALAQGGRQVVTSRAII